VIRRIRHRGLRRLYDDDDCRGIAPLHAELLREVLTLLEGATGPADLDLPGYRLHPLKGDRRGQWAVKVSANWRVTFRFEGGDATDVDYEDYH
jgi:proteic killer suppression protein